MSQTTKATYVHTAQVHNLKSPRAVVPELLKLFSPESVLDVGCGIGTWLHEFASAGIGVFGIDGDFVDREQLKEFISPDFFMPIDLQFPFNLNRKFDLVLSLEVAEHLPESSAIGFVNSLCQHSDVIIFSAAIPGQGGQNHLNEKWPDYWIKLFEKEGLKTYDILRPHFWDNEDVDWWYKQNMLVFSRKAIEGILGQPFINKVIHPDLFKQNLDYIIYL